VGSRLGTLDLSKLDPVAIAKIIGRTPHDLGDGCGEACEADDATCICGELYLGAAKAILKYLREAAA
jgi:hypothetical protein